MATIQNAVQAMVDKLVTDMKGSTPLSAEDQALVSNAITKLADNDRLEKAIIAVAEEHLDVATGELTNASTVVQELKTQLAAQVTNLALLPTLETTFNTMSDALVSKVAEAISDLPAKLVDPTYRLAEPEFKLDFYDNTTSLLQSGGQTFGAYNTISLVNYDANTFCVYFDGGNKTSATNKATLMTLNAQGEVSQSSRATQLLTSNGQDKLGLCVLPSQETTLFTYITASKQLTVYKSGSFTTEATQDTEYFKIYQDKVTKCLYTVDAKILNEFDGQVWVQKRDQVFNSESEFDAWAASQALLPLHEKVLIPYSSHIDIDSRSGYSSGLSYLDITRPSFKTELAIKNGSFIDIPVVGNQKITRYSQEELVHTSNSYQFTRSFKGKVLLPNIHKPIKASLESVVPGNNHYHNSEHYHSHRAPQLIAFSPIHRALIVYQYFRFYNSSNSSDSGKTLCRVYFD
ncbi:hypothetical protein [Pseudoalteromonas aurantia]|uniref:Uncharacterized protein n=1 Tax=Pseudoalteromonas aurantia TaxID=43654 RepID=A0ABY2VT13_9GAMM|nr:hypothetical protein [Pseudoalteromonas aurantia]TMO67258.1 hypothetical protein CWC18_00990 [Pseudoalteromonas aurantia]TMO70879.1 hypothetical protein CWC20_19060 [Pseudoalteromonas aurantia]